MSDSATIQRHFHPKYLVIPFIIAAFVLVFGLVVMWLWNAVMPQVFGVTTITYWQAVILLVLSKIFFHGWHSNHRERFHDCTDLRYRSSLAKWWTCLSDEEKARLRKSWEADPQTNPENADS
ncbi:MAG: hypothetical protein ACOZB3_00275 [Calditrichota bacterium]